MAKVLEYLDGSDRNYGRCMSTFLFDDEVDLEEVVKTVNSIWEQNEGTLSYHDIINDKFRKHLIDIKEIKSVIW